MGQMNNNWKVSSIPSVRPGYCDYRNSTVPSARTSVPSESRHETVRARWHRADPLGEPELVWSVPALCEDVPAQRHPYRMRADATMPTGRRVHQRDLAAVGAGGVLLVVARRDRRTILRPYDVRRCQVTNPSIDPLRSRWVRTYTWGGRRSASERTHGACKTGSAHYVRAMSFGA